MERLLLFGATLKENYDEEISAIPELVGPLTDIVKKIKLSIQPELNAPCSIRGSSLLVSVLNNLSYQYRSLMSRKLSFLLLSIDLIAFAEHLKEKESAVYTKIAEAGALFTKTMEEMEMKLKSVNESFGFPYFVLLQQQLVAEYLMTMLQSLYLLLQGRIQQSLTVVEEKKIDPEIQARLEAERAKEEEGLDAATIAKIREKRAAKEAKKNKKAGGKTKKLNIGNGLQLILDAIMSTYSTV